MSEIQKQNKRRVEAIWYIVWRVERVESETAKDGTEVKRLVEKGIGQRKKNQIQQKCV